MFRWPPQRTAQPCGGRRLAESNRWNIPLEAESDLRLSVKPRISESASEQAFSGRRALLIAAVSLLALAAGALAALGLLLAKADYR